MRAILEGDPRDLAVPSHGSGKLRTALRIEFVARDRDRQYRSERTEKAPLPLEKQISLAAVGKTKDQRVAGSGSRVSVAANSYLKDSEGPSADERDASDIQTREAALQYVAIVPHVHVAALAC